MAERARNSGSAGDRLSNPLRSDVPHHFHSPSNSGSRALQVLQYIRRMKPFALRRRSGAVAGVVCCRLRLARSEAAGGPHATARFHHRDCGRSDRTATHCSRGTMAHTAGAHRLPARGRRRNRRDCPYRRGPSFRDLAPAGRRREQVRRQRQHCSRIRCPFRPRRLHHLHRYIPACGQQLPLSLARLRPDRRLRARHIDRPLPADDGRAQLLAGTLGQGIYRLREGEQAQLCLLRPRHVAASGRRAVQAQGRH